MHCRDRKIKDDRKTRGENGRRKGKEIRVMAREASGDMEETKLGRSGKQRRDSAGKQMDGMNEKQTIRN